MADRVTRKDVKQGKNALDYPQRYVQPFNVSTIAGHLIVHTVESRKIWVSLGHYAS